MPDTPATRTDTAGASQADDWAQVRDGARTGEQRARVAAAIRQADIAWITVYTGQIRPTRAGIPARGPVWYRLALLFHGVLADSGAYGHLAQLRTFGCAAAEPIVSAWLSSPADPVHDDALDGEPPTVAQRLGVDDAFTLVNGDTQAAHLSTLLDAAQDAHVFGVPDHRIELVTAIRHHDTSTVVRVVVDTPHGNAFASEPLELGVLADPDRRGVEAATAALRRIADVVSAMFADYAQAVWQAPPPMPMPDRADTPPGRAFPELRVDQPAEPTPPPTPSPALTPRTPAADGDRPRRRTR